VEFCKTGMYRMGSALKLVDRCMHQGEVESYKTSQPFFGLTTLFPTFFRMNVSFISMIAHSFNFTSPLSFSYRKAKHLPIQSSHLRLDLCKKRIQLLKIRLLLRPSNRQPLLCIRFRDLISSALALQNEVSKRQGQG
jgi:hypothetical protein